MGKSHSFTGTTTKPNFPPRYNVAPTQHVPIVRAAHYGLPVCLQAPRDEHSARAPGQAQSLDQRLLDAMETRVERAQKGPTALGIAVFFEPEHARLACWQFYLVYRYSIRGLRGLQV